MLERLRHRSRALRATLGGVAPAALAYAANLNALPFEAYLQTDRRLPAPRRAGRCRRLAQPARDRQKLLALRLKRKAPDA